MIDHIFQICINNLAVAFWHHFSCSSWKQNNLNTGHSVDTCQFVWVRLKRAGRQVRFPHDYQTFCNRFLSKSQSPTLYIHSSAHLFSLFMQCWYCQIHVSVQINPNLEAEERTKKDDIKCKELINTFLMKKILFGAVGQARSPPETPCNLNYSMIILSLVPFPIQLKPIYQCRNKSSPRVKKFVSARSFEWALPAIYSCAFMQGCTSLQD